MGVLIILNRLFSKSNQGQKRSFKNKRTDFAEIIDSNSHEYSKFVR